MKKILITGSEGFIGSHLVEKLILQNYNVKCLVLYNSFNNIGNLSYINEKLINDCEIVFGDVRDQEQMNKILKGCDAIINLAALIGIPYSYRAVKSYIDINVIGTYNLLQSSLNNNVEKIIHTSTSEVYGTAQFVPITEQHPKNAQSPYAASKISADSLVTSFNKSFGLNSLIIRPFNTFGPRQSNRAIIPTIITQFMTENKLSLGNLKPKRDFTYVDDTVQAFTDALKINKKYNGKVLNLGTGKSCSVFDLSKSISKLLNKKLIIKKNRERLRPNKSEVFNLVASNLEAKKFLNWKPKYIGKKGFDNALKLTIDFFKDHKPKKNNKFIY
ncbi:SDR family NAD(P)-dependent oxidoreductase [Candidatus Pelagibacter sp.]|nr:SDR family NAD(P)-dependent oxidoreductase [Candidatus Pelagibacter sp.]